MEQERRNVSPHGETFLVWEVDEYPRYERSLFWYLAAGVVGIGFLWYALATVNFLFALIVIIFAIILLLSGTREPHRLRAALTEDGLELGTRFHDWHDFTAFWLVYDPPLVKTLYLAPKSALQPPFGVPLGGANPNLVREKILRYVKEDLERDDEPFCDSLARLLKI